MKHRIVLAAAAAFTAGLAAADGQRHALAPSYVEECGSCHVAYPPALLSAASWRAVIGGLDRHFGTDASVEAGKARALSAWLEARAGRRESTGARGEPLLRITDTAWFRKEHRDGHDGLTAAVWRSTAVGSAANCSACHRDAERGDYRESGLRLPR